MGCCTILLGESEGKVGMRSVAEAGIQLDAGQCVLCPMTYAGTFTGTRETGDSGDRVGAIISITDG